MNPATFGCRRIHGYTIDAAALVPAAGRSTPGSDFAEGAVEQARQLVGFLFLAEQRNA